MRHVALFVVGLALALAIVQAPTAHTHTFAHEATERHVGNLFHTHVPLGHRPNSTDPLLRAYDPNEDALFLNWSLSSAVDFWKLTVIDLPAARISPPLPTIEECRHVVFLPPAHAPPTQAVLTSRAPPV